MSELKYINFSKKEHFTEPKPVFTVNNYETLLQLITTSDYNYEDNTWYERGTNTLKEVDINHIKTTDGIDISKNNIGDAGAIALAGALRYNKMLKNLYLGNINIGDKGAIALAGALKNKTNLVNLYLGNQPNVDIGNNNTIGNDGAKALADVLRNITSLNYFDLTRNNLGAAGAIALAGAFTDMKSLGILYLSKNNIGDTGAIALADALRNNTNLGNLDLSKNNIGDTGAIALADALRNNTNLGWLDLGDNNIGDDGVKAMASALQNNSSLQTLVFADNNIGNDGAIALAGALRNKPRLRGIYIISDNIDAFVVVKHKMVVRAERARYYYPYTLSLKNNKPSIKIGQTFVDLAQINYDLIKFNSDTIDTINNYTISDDKLFLVGSKGGGIFIDFSSETDIDLSSITNDRVKIVLYDIVSAKNNINLTVSNSDTILNDIPITPIYKSITIVGGTILDSAIKLFSEKLNKVYEFTDKSKLDYPKITYNNGIITTTVQTNYILPLPTTTSVPPTTQPTTTSQPQSNISDLSTLIVDNNVVMSYNTIVEPDVEALKENIKKQTDLEDVIITVVKNEQFNAQTTYKVIIQMIPKANTNLNDLSKNINENADKLLTVPENKENKENKEDKGKKSYLIYIVIFIILLIGLFAYLKLSHKI